MERSERIDRLHAECARRILVLDGAMGTMIQAAGLSAEDYCGARFAEWTVPLQGNNDLLCLTRPDVIQDIHTAYLEAGADMLETNTFNAQAISQADYGMEALSAEMNREAARIACAARDAHEARHVGAVKWVAGVLGPTNRTASISPDVNDPAARNVTFDELRDAYGEAARALIVGGADLLIVETIFDTLNAKAALFAIDEAFEATGVRLPLMISATITDLSGRTLSGQTPEAFWNSVRHARPFSVGLNCALGAAELRQYVAALANVADTRVSAHPNAGLPNAFGGYDEMPEETAGHLGEWARTGLVNLVGGCCGTTPAHIERIAAAVDGVAPREIAEAMPALRLSGLEPFQLAS